MGAGQVSRCLSEANTVIVPRKLFACQQIDIGVVDTKGIDQASAQEDIDTHFDDPHAMVLICTRFGEAPDLAAMNLIRRATVLHTDSSLEDRIALLVLPRNEEATDMKDEATNDFVEAVEEG
jgi:hypothetical protein